RYVSIRYTGITVEANSELQGLTVGCVGSGTTIEYVESFNSDDDGFEFFGGTVNCKYLVSAFNSDDAFDYDQGFRGKGQFWFVLQSDVLGNRAGEYDSGDKGALSASPKSNPQLWNCTYLGSGPNSANAKNDFALIYKEHAGGGHYNSIFADFRDKAIQIEDVDGADARERLEAGELKLENNIWFRTAGDDLNAIVDQDFVRTYLAANNNYVVNPSLRGVSRTNDGNLDPRPNIGAHPYFQQRKDYPAGDPFFEQVDYIGAFGDDQWLTGWTALSMIGIAGELTATDVEVVSSTASDYSLSQNYPNPFNPSTTIEFSVPARSDVTIDVYNALGQNVATVVDGQYAAGSYSVIFDASSLPSGVYMYTLKSGSTTIAKQMILSK
ncbi:MAG: hypothetical protein CL946_12860, partial [Ectothiorhodospiraceae bacterium]|nr:hypothetical protein [Ectothiorhodospiraceae bacterium]